MTTAPPSGPDGATRQTTDATDTADTTRQAWLAAEQAVRARMDSGAGCGVTRREQLVGLSGMQMMQKMLAGEFPYPPIGQTLDFTLIELGPGLAVFQGTPKAAHLNPLGTVHGGWYATLLDSAVGCAVHTTMPAGRAYTTAELSLNIVRAAWPDREPLRAIGQVLHTGKQLATAEGRIVDAAGRLYAHATTTCLVFEVPGVQA